MKTHMIAVFSDENVRLSGAEALEELGLEVDPVKGELEPLETTSTSNDLDGSI